MMQRGAYSLAGRPHARPLRPDDVLGERRSSFGKFRKASGWWH
jgi:hypothetical protein